MGLPEVECVRNNCGGAGRLRVRGLEFARTSGAEVLFGLQKRAAARESNFAEIERLAADVRLLRGEPGSPLYQKDPEEWLASQVRARLETVDASLRATPVYSQAPACLGGQRGLIDLLAVDYPGRLAVLELKASQDIHLPLQALDYWMRVKWHLDRDEFASHGYFPGVALRKDPPRLLLISPALEFHPTTEIVMQFFSSAVEVERVGVGAAWRQKLQVMFRMRGAQRRRSLRALRRLASSRKFLLFRPIPGVFFSSSPATYRSCQSLHRSRRVCTNAPQGSHSRERSTGLALLWRAIMTLNLDFPTT